jgi:hypothetical protein
MSAPNGVDVSREEVKHQKHGSINKSYQQFYAKNLICIQKHGSNKS